ncbi:hypothetical protein Hdeb2414_s0018g00538711 [Helianthus debilis subsp. tardiflorus]
MIHKPVPMVVVHVPSPPLGMGRERNRDAERQLTGDCLQTRNRLPARELKSSSLGFSGENSRVQRW